MGCTNFLFHHKNKNKRSALLCILPKNSGYRRNLMSQLHKTVRNYRIHTESPEPTSLQMRATCNYHSPCVQQVTNLFQRTNWRIGFRSWNTVYKLLKHQKGINSKYVNTALWKTLWIWMEQHKMMESALSRKFIRTTT